MAAGDRKVKITEITITRANPVLYTAHWSFFVENKVGADAPSGGGSFSGSFGTAAAWRAMTGTQMETQVTAEVTTSLNTPARDSVT
jgi:hypothetical protein